MKTLRILYLLASAAVVLGFSGCSKEEFAGDRELPHVGEKVTISVSLPESVATKVAMSELEDGSALALSWEAGDKLLVVSGEASQEFTIKEGFTDKYAEFEGVALEGTEFNVILSRSGADYKTRSYHAQTQAGNASTDHLLYDAWLEGVDSYSSVCFSKAWAEEHGGDFCQNGLVKFYLKMPEGVESVSELILSADDKVFYADNFSVKSDNVHVALADGTLSGQVLTAYVMTSAKEAEISSDATLTLTAVTDAGVYTKSFVPGKNIKPGKMNIVQLNDHNWTVAASGTGTETDPYLLRTASDLVSMSGKVTESGTTYFKMANDIDLSGVEWTPAFNGASIDFDGNSKTISNLTCNAESGKQSLLGKFTGKCVNLNITDARIGNETLGSDICAILAGEANAEISGVHVTGTVSSNLRRTGGVVGYLTGGSMSDCSAKVSVKSTSGANIGGLVGQAYAGASSKVSNCHLLAGSVVEGAGESVGGIAGFSNTPIIACSVKNSTITTANNACGGITGTASADITDCEVFEATVKVTSTSKDYAGGIAGRNQAMVAIRKCSVVRSTVSARRVVAGVLGYVEKVGASISDCYTHNCTISASHRRAAGILGESAVSTGVTVSRCYSTSSVSAQYTVAGIFAFDKSDSQNTIEKCIAWNKSLKQTKEASTVPTYYSGVIIGNTSLTNTLTACYRKSDLTLNVPTADAAYQPVDQNDCNADNPLTGGVYDAESNYGWSNLFPYHGKATDLETVSAVAKMLEWDETVWNLDGDLPTLR